MKTVRLPSVNSGMSVYIAAKKESVLVKGVCHPIKWMGGVVREMIIPQGDDMNFTFLKDDEGAMFRT